MRIVPNGGPIIFDGSCGVCQLIVSILKRLDWFHRLDFHSNLNPLTFQKFPMNLRDRSTIEILALDEKKGWLGGYLACLWISKRLPILWFFLPLSWIPGSNFLGKKAYALVAKNRHIISNLLGLDSCRL